MNEYNLPRWYISVFEIICDFQKSADEDGNMIASTLVGYLNALVDTNVITEQESRYLFLILMAAT